jgi:hypothetical protein
MAIFRSMLIFRYFFFHEELIKETAKFNLSGIDSDNQKDAEKSEG